MNTINNPIGIVRTPFKTRFGTPRQPHLVPSAKATIEIFPHPDLNGCLEGLEAFSHLWVVFLFHENTNSRVRGKVHPPRLGGENIGLFASRSPHRPNPIGLSLVKILRVDSWNIEVSGTDMVDGTPVLDIKPYIPESDCRPEAIGGWTEKVVTPQLDVLFTLEASDQLQKLVAPEEQSEVCELIVQTLRQDPRPIVYKNDKQKKYRSSHAVYLNNLDVHFEIIDSKSMQVFKVLRT